jgi:hypothetical protein
LELVAPVAITSGTEYFLTSEGSMVTQAEVSPFVATPLVGSSLALTGSNYAWSNQSDLAVMFRQPDNYPAGTASNPVIQVQLSAQFEAYVTRPVAGVSNHGWITCYVYDKLTGDLAAELLVQGGVGDNITYPKAGHWIGVVPSGTNKFCIVVDHTTNGGTTWNYRVGEFTFNGTNAVTFAWKTALGTAEADQGQFCGIGTGISSGKIAVKRTQSTQLLVLQVHIL